MAIQILSMKKISHVPQFCKHGEFSSVYNHRKFPTDLSPGRKVYDDMLLRNDYIQNKNWEIDFHQVMITKKYRKSVKQARRWEKSYNLLWVTVSGKLMRLNCKELGGRIQRGVESKKKLRGQNYSVKETEASGNQNPCLFHLMYNFMSLYFP